MPSAYLLDSECIDFSIGMRVINTLIHNIDTALSAAKSTAVKFAICPGHLNSLLDVVTPCWWSRQSSFPRKYHCNYSYMFKKLPDVFSPEFNDLLLSKKIMCLMVSSDFMNNAKYDVINMICRLILLFLEVKDVFETSCLLSECFVVVNQYRQ